MPLFSAVSWRMFPKECVLSRVTLSRASSMVTLIKLEALAPVQLGSCSSCSSCEMASFLNWMCRVVHVDSLFGHDAFERW